MTADGWRRHYFPVVSLILLALTMIGFSDNLFTRIDQRSNHDPKFIVHGLFCLAWMLFFAVQANLVGLGNVRLHRRLGLASVVIAIGVTLSTLYIFVMVWKGWGALHEYGQANRLLLPCYALLVVLGLLSRRRPDRHKRLLYIATLYMMEPVLSRAFDPFEPLMTSMSGDQIDQAWWWFFVIVWNSFFLSLFAYDRIVAGRIHPITAGGFALFGSIWALVFVV